MPNDSRPKRMETVQIGKAAVNYVREVFNDMNWSVNPLSDEDFGADLHVQPFNSVKRTPLGREFNVQIKGRTRPRIANREALCPVRTGHVRSWLDSQLPLLLVLCEVQRDAGSRVTRAWFTWVDHRVYEEVGWPIWGDTLGKSQTMTLRLPTDQPFHVACQTALLDYLSQWRPAGHTVRGLKKYLSSLSLGKKELHDIREDGLRWSLFVLPIKYKPYGTGKAGRIAAGHHKLLRHGCRTLLLLGKPATGKTITVDRVFAKPSSGLVPVSIKEPLLSGTKDFVQYVRDKCGVANNDHFQSLQSKGHFLLMLDGLSELRHSKEVACTVSELASQLVETRFIVTCRTNDYEDIGGLNDFDVWEIADLDDKAQDRFLSRQPEEVNKAAHNAIGEDPALRNLCRNQFLFLIFVSLMPELKGKRLRRSDLYDHYLSKYLDWVGVRGLERMYLLELLSKIAFAIRKEGVSSRTSIKTERLRQVLQDEVGTDHVASVEADLDQYGLIEKTEDGSARFFQETLQEYLCAYHLVSRGVLPGRFAVGPGGLSYEGVEIDEMVKEFYIELAGIERLGLQPTDGRG